MALDTSGFVPKGNLNTDESALGTSGRRATVKKVLRRLSAYRLLIVVSAVMAVVSVFFSLMVPLLIGDVIDCIDMLYGSRMTEDLPEVIYGEMQTRLIEAAVSAVIVGVCTYVMNLVNNRITFLTVRDIRNDALAKISVLPLSYIDSHSQGDIVSRVMSDAETLVDGILMGFSQLFTGVLTVIGTVVFMRYSALSIS